MRSLLVSALVLLLLVGLVPHQLAVASHGRLRPSSVEVVQIPEEPHSMELVTIIAYFTNYTPVDVDLSVEMTISPLLEANVTVVEDPGDGNADLTVTVYLDGSPAPKAYVRVHEGESWGDVAASGLTGEDGEAVFHVQGGVPPNTYLVEAYFDRDGDGLFEYWGWTVALVWWSGGSADVDLQLLNDVVGLQPITYSYTADMRELGLGTYGSGIPGLPAYTVTGYTTNPLPPMGIALKLSSHVDYSIVADGQVVYEASYDVLPGSGMLAAPIVLAVVSQALNDTSLFNETLGLAPHGWAWPSGEPLNVTVVVFDDDGVENATLLYSPDNTTWASVPLRDSPIMDEIRRIVDSINQVIEELEELLASFGIIIDLPELQVPVYAGEGTIPGQEPGHYVLFKAVATDAENMTSESPIGLYYVYNSTSTTSVLIVDPHVLLWLLQVDYERMPIPVPVPEPPELPVPNMTVAERFHHWEYLAELYRIHVAWPGLKVVEALAEVEPDLVVLSNTLLGVNWTYPELLDWDLADWVIGNTTVMRLLLDYLSEHNAGLIVTHGSLFDMYLWRDVDDRVKIGVRGHVGYGLEDLGIPGDEELVEEETIAAAVGLRELCVWERVRDRLAELLYELGGLLESYGIPYGPELKEVALKLGSLPLVAPYMDWNGTLVFTREAEAAGWRIPVGPVTLEDVPPTSIGWQLGELRAIAYYIPYLSRLLKRLPRVLLALLPVKVIAWSPDMRAGIVAYDKYWSAEGFRGVYVSFEVEASASPIAKWILQEAARWATSWTPKPSRARPARFVTILRH